MIAKRKRIKLAAWSGLILMLVAACGALTGEESTPTPNPREPFSARRESGAGYVVVWNGDTRGHEPGAEAEFDVGLANKTDQDWPGRYCLQLMDGQLSQVIVTLEQREFNLEPGVGFSNTLTVQLPEILDPGTYGLSLVVRRPGGALVDLVPIQIGQTEGTRPPTTQRDTDAALEACPPRTETDTGPADPLVATAKADLAQELDLSPDQIQVQSVTQTVFPDTSLGVPEPGQVYAQVQTPGYVIKLEAAGEVYVYHASQERIVAVPSDEGERPAGQIAVTDVSVTPTQIVVWGRSTLPEGTCVSAELWADGVLLPWWPADACAPVEQGVWQLMVPLEAEQSLQPGVQYMLRAYQPGGPNVVATFPFDLDEPPSPAPDQDLSLLGPESTALRNGET